MAAQISIQQTPVLLHPLPCRPYNPVLSSTWNDVDRRFTPVRFQEAGAAKVYTTVTIPPLSVNPRTIQIKSGISMPYESVHARHVARLQSKALPFLTNWRSMAGIPSVSKHQTSLKMTRTSKVSLQTLLYSACCNLLAHTDCLTV